MNQKCVAVIDNRGTTVKGIYRVSGVKSKVEKLCQAFENGAELVDLTDIQPNVIANVVKLYMRQLPEPLMTFRLYNDFIRVGRSCPAPGEGQPDPDEKEAVSQLKQLACKMYIVTAAIEDSVTAQKILYPFKTSKECES